MSQTHRAEEIAQVIGPFQKVALVPAMAQTVSVTVDPRLLATRAEAGARWRVAGGPFWLVLGASLRDFSPRSMLGHVIINYNLRWFNSTRAFSRNSTDSNSNVADAQYLRNAALFQHDA